MLRRDGLVKVVDFGLAKLISQQELPALDSEAPTSFRTNPGTVMGTAYAAAHKVKEMVTIG